MPICTHALCLPGYDQQDMWFCFLGTNYALTLMQLTLARLHLGEQYCRVTQVFGTGIRIPKTNPLHEPTRNPLFTACKAYCSSRKASWTTKCSWKDCNSCPECPGKNTGACASCIYRDTVAKQLYSMIIPCTGNYIHPDAIANATFSSQVVISPVQIDHQV